MTFSAIASGGNHTCGLRSDNGIAICWGDDRKGTNAYQGQARPPYGERFSAISAGEDFTCALRLEDSSPVCWGRGFRHGVPEHREFELFKAESFAEISNGDGFACALREDGTAACWGDNYADKATPPPERFSAISSDTDHVCGLRGADGHAVCWGSNREPGNYSGEYKGMAAPPLGKRFSDISSGRAHTCALDVEGTAHCWGDDEWRQSSPPAGERFVSIASFSTYSCALRADDIAICWGDKFAFEDVEPVLPGKVMTLDSGSSATGLCGLRPDGSAVCFDANYHGQGSPPEGGGFQAISGGTAHTCTLRNDGSAVCWGINVEPSRGYWIGQAYPPKEERFKAISSGPFATCALRIDGTPACWGEGYNTPEPERRTYESIANERFTEVTSGYYHSCGLRVDGIPVCWGNLDPKWEYTRLWPPEGERFTSIEAGDDYHLWAQVRRLNGLLGEEYQRRRLPPGRLEVCQDQLRSRHDVRFIRRPFLPLLRVHSRLVGAG